MIARKAEVATQAERSSADFPPTFCRHQPIPSKCRLKSAGCRLKLAGCRLKSAGKCRLKSANVGWSRRVSAEVGHSGRFYTPVAPCSFKFFGFTKIFAQYTHLFTCSIFSWFFKSIEESKIFLHWRHLKTPQVCKCHFNDELRVKIFAHFSQTIWQFTVDWRIKNFQSIVFAISAFWPQMCSVFWRAQKCILKKFSTSEVQWI